MIYSDPTLGMNIGVPFIIFGSLMHSLRIEDGVVAFLSFPTKIAFEPGCEAPSASFPHFAFAVYVPRRYQTTSSKNVYIYIHMHGLYCNGMECNKMLASCNVM